MKKILILSLLPLVSCSPYKNVLQPLHNSPKHIEWYFSYKAMAIRDDIALKNPTYSNNKLDSLVNIEIGKIMLSINPQQYEQIRQAYAYQYYNMLTDQ